MSDGIDHLVDELRDLGNRLGPALTPLGHDELLLSITDAARRLFDAAACSLALLDDNDEELVFRVASGEGASDVVGLRMPAGRGIAGWVVMSGQPIAIEDVTHDPRFAADIAASSGYVPHSILAMPLETRRRMLGVIEVLDRRAGTEGRGDDMELLAVFAHQAALAIEGSRIFTSLGDQLLRAAAAAVAGTSLGTALEQRLATARGQQAELVELAVLFHELGQVGPEEQAAATRIVRELLAYVRERRA